MPIILLRDRSHFSGKRRSFSILNTMRITPTLPLYTQPPISLPSQLSCKNCTTLPTPSSPSILSSSPLTLTRTGPTLSGCHRSNARRSRSLRDSFGECKGEKRKAVRAAGVISVGESGGKKSGQGMERNVREDGELDMADHRDSYLFHAPRAACAHFLRSASSLSLSCSFLTLSRANSLRTRFSFSLFASSRRATSFSYMFRSETIDFLNSA